MVPAMIRVGMHEAKTNLSKLVDQALGGEEVTITRNGMPVAKIVPLEPRTPSLNDVRGIWKGKVRMDDPFEPLPDWMIDAFEGAGEDDPTR